MRPPDNPKLRTPWVADDRELKTIWFHAMERLTISQLARQIRLDQESVRNKTWDRDYAPAKIAALHVAQQVFLYRTKDNPSLRRGLLAWPS